MSINGISSGLSALRHQSAALDHGAEKLTRGTSGEVPEASPARREGEGVGVQEGGVVGGAVEMIVARRMFTAAVKMAQVANDDIGEALRLGDYDSR